MFTAAFYFFAEKIIKSKLSKVRVYESVRFREFSVFNGQKSFCTCSYHLPHR